MRDKGKSFVFILGISIITLIMLVIGSFIFKKDSSLIFKDEGYVIAGSSERYYFGSGTTYKENLRGEYSFKDSNDKVISVNTDSFIHYLNGNIGFMQDAAIMDLDSAKSSIIPYYNVSINTTISMINDMYTISIPTKTLSFNSILGRISDNKYIVAGKDIRLVFADNPVSVMGDYFEITFVSDGIARIENQDGTYQTVCQGTYLYVSDSVVIDLGDMKVVSDGESFMSLSQITINGNENIDVLKDGAVDIDNMNGNDGSDNTYDNSDINDGNNIDGSLGENGDNIDSDDNEVIHDVDIKLVNATIYTNGIKASFVYNNIMDIKGNLKFNIKNLDDGSSEYMSVIDKSRKTQDFAIESLSSDTNYLITIYSEDGNNVSQYFQQSFRTLELGLSISKVYSSSSSLAYIVNYDDESMVTKTTLSLFDSKGNSVSSDIESLRDDNKEVIFTDLESNSLYTVKVMSVLMNGVSYENVYNISRDDSTLKVAPRTTGDTKLSVLGSKSNVKLSVSGISDIDSSIISYTYKIYRRDDIDNQVFDGSNYVYSKVVNVSKDSTKSSMKISLDDMNVNEKSGNYRFSVDISYFDNEKKLVLKTLMLSESFFLSNDDSEEESNDDVSVSFKQNVKTYNTIGGVVSVKDKTNTIKLGENGQTEFSLKYYTGSYSEATTVMYKNYVVSNDMISSGKFDIDIEISNLLSGSGYILELYGNVYVDGVLVPNTLIDRSFTGETSTDVDKLKFSVIDTYTSTDDNVINFTGTIVSTNALNTDTLNKVSAKLYKGSRAEVGNQIGNTITINGDDIYNQVYSFTNSSFGIYNVFDLISLSGGSLFSNYTIEIVDAYYSSGNKTVVEDNVYTYSISTMYMIEKQIDDPTISVAPILNGNINPSYDKNTIIGYEVTVGAAIEQLKSKIGENGIESINYYIYSANSDGSVSDEPIISFKSNDFSYEMLFDGINSYNRGGSYVFMYDISISGYEENYPTKKVMSNVFTPERQMPEYSIYKYSSTNDSIIYKYKFKDIDEAIHKEEDDTFKLYYKVNDGDINVLGDLKISDDYENIVISNLNYGDNYSIYYYKEITDNIPILTEIENGTFNGNRDISDIKYSLEYSAYDNRLGVRLFNIDRSTILYEVIIKDRNNSLKSYNKIYNTYDLETCPNGDGSCIVIDYADISEFIRHDTDVYVKVYYDNGLVGINMINSSCNGISNGDCAFVFESSNEYLNITDNDVSVLEYSSSIFKYSYTDGSDSISISDYFDNDSSIKLDLSYVNNGILFGDVDIFDVKSVSYDSIDTDNGTYFRFDSIIPKVKSKMTDNSINSVSLDATFSGLTLENLKSQFQLENGNYYVYVNLYSDSDCYNLVGSDKMSINSDLSVSDAKFSLLLPATVYYYKLYAKLKQNDGRYEMVELFDSEVTSSYVNKTFSISTRDVSKILTNVAAFYDETASSSNTKRSGYYSGTNTGRLFVVRTFISTMNEYNFGLRLQLLDSDGNDYLKDHVGNFSVNGTFGLFDLSNKYSSSYGKFNVGDVKYFSDYSKLVTSSANDRGYFSFYLDDDFVFGNGQYRLVVTAVSTTKLDDGSYAELTLYDSLLATSSDQKNLYSRIKVSELKEPEFIFSPGTNSKGDILVNISVNDEDFTIINKEGNMNGTRGYYNVRLVDSDGNTVKDINNNEAIVKRKYSDTSQLVFDGSKYKLKTDTYYFIHVETYIYRNNASLSEKLEYVDQSKIVYTTSSSGVSLGIVSTNATANTITLTYNGSSQLSEIDRIIYSISLDGGSTLVSSKVINKTSTTPIFNSDGSTYKVSFTGLKLTNNKTYNITVGYYHKKSDGTYERLFGSNIAYAVTYTK